MKLEGVKKFFRGCRVFAAAFVCVWGVPIFFVFSGTLSDSLGRFLRVDPSFTGGLVAQEFLDPVGNARTEGGLARYTVHQPVTGARWQKSAEYWQLVFDFNEAQRNVVVYISADNMEKSAALPPDGFLGARPWNFALKIHGGQGKVYDSGGAFICDTEVYQLNDGSTVKARIPLQDKRLQNLLGAKKTWHCIVFEGEDGDGQKINGQKGGLEIVPLEARMAAQKKLGKGNKPSPLCKAEKKR